MVNKANMNKEELAKFLPREIAILQKVSHPHIIKMFQIVETKCQCFFVTEIAEKWQCSGLSELQMCSN